MGSIFADCSKFKQVEIENTIIQVKNINRYLKTMLNPGEITGMEKKEMKMKGAKRAQVLPKNP